MSIEVGEDIGLEVHQDIDQFLGIEEGKGFVQMGDSEDHLDYEKHAEDEDAILVLKENRWDEIIRLYFKK